MDKSYVLRLTDISVDYLGRDCTRVLGLGQSLTFNRCPAVEVLRQRRTDLVLLNPHDQRCGS